MKEVKFSKDTKPAEDETEMSADEAARLYSEGGFYIVKDLPVGTEFGCDLKSYNTGLSTYFKFDLILHLFDSGSKFLGLKMIPKGCHFLYYSSVGKDSDISPRRGFFINIEPGDVIVHRFDPKTEDIVDDVSAEEVERFRLNLRNIDGQLGAYPFGSWSKWVSLSSRLNMDLIQKYKVKSDAGDNSLLDVSYNFTAVRKQKYPDGASAAEISLHSLDSSFQLDTWLRGHESSDAVLVELQLAFILFLIGQQYDSFNQWKLVVDMMCGCGESLNKYPKLFISFLNDLHFQVIHNHMVSLILHSVETE